MLESFIYVDEWSPSADHWQDVRTGGGEGLLVCAVLAVFVPVHRALSVCSEANYSQVGGGGLIAGIGAYIKRLRPEVKIIGVEPYGANALYLSLKVHVPLSACTVIQILRHA